MRRAVRTIIYFCCILSALAASGPTEEPEEMDEHADLPPTHSINPKLYTAGFEYAEGPALNQDGDIFVANYRANGTIGRITADGTASVFCDLRETRSLEGREVQANGLKIDGEGRLIVADSGAGRLLRISADGKTIDVLADRCEGSRFNSIDDVALDGDGNIFFSDPGGSSVSNPIGSVYRYAIQTAKVTLLATDLAYPDGLAVTPNGKYLCVAEGQRYRLLIFDLSEEGELTNRRVLIDFPTETRGLIVGGTTPPGGMVFDAAGRLYVAMSTGGVINVVEVPSGKLIRQYSAGGDDATNCHFFKDSLFITVASKEAVFRLNLGVEGYDYAHGTNHNPLQ
jgi:gluconolactonase